MPNYTMVNLKCQPFLEIYFMAAIIYKKEVGKLYIIRNGEIIYNLQKIKKAGFTPALLFLVEFSNT